MSHFIIWCFLCFCYAIAAWLGTLVFDAHFLDSITQVQAACIYSGVALAVHWMAVRWR